VTLFGDAPADGTASPVSAVELRRTGWLLGLAALALYPLVKYGLALRLSGVLLPSLVLAVVYLVGIWLYRTVMRAGYSGSPLLAAGVGIAAGLAAWFVCPSGLRLLMTGELAALVLAGLLVGRLARTADRRLHLYLAGLAVVVAATVVIQAAKWPELMRSFSGLATMWTEDMRDNLTGSGYGEDAADAILGPVQSAFKLLSRLLPAATILNVIAQFSIGFLWFLARDIRAGGAGARLVPFTRWKVPFALTPFVVVAILFRLLGGDAIRLAADNVLLLLSFYYCVGGVALVQHVLTRLGLPIWARIAGYLVLALFGVLAYFVTVLLGFVDSFADWRNVTKKEMELD